MYSAESPKTCENRSRPGFDELNVGEWRVVVDGVEGALEGCCLPLMVVVVVVVVEFWRQKTRVPGLSRGVICVILRFAVLIQYRRMTDRHTDRQTHDDG